jgi:NitT/TauT family transport system substrate-binding protein
MKKFFNKSTLVVISVLLISMLIAGCSNQSAQTPEPSKEEQSEELPEIRLSWGNDLHTAIPYVPIKLVDEFKKTGVYFNPLSEDKFELIENGKKLAIISFIPTKGGSEVATLMGQNHLDAALTSNTAMLTAIDKGTDIKILHPVQTGGISLVFSPDKDFYGWEQVKDYIVNSNVPVKIGYHSPISGPRILMESILKEEGLKVTEDPGDASADVLLVDLKGANNLIPSLSGKQVDAWVGPTAYPETAEYRNLGKIVLKLEDFPPKGKWTNFPCCIFAVRQEIADNHPEVVKALTHLLDESCKFCMEKRPEAAEALSGFIGIEAEIIENATIRYTTDPSEEWLNGIKVYVDALNKMDKFSDRLKGKDFDEVVKQAFDFSFINELNK